MSKGELGGRCNMSSCKTEIPATFYNHSTRKHYCGPCADRLNSDPYNKRDAHEMFGHDLCTEVPLENVTYLRTIEKTIEENPTRIIEKQGLPKTRAQRRAEMRANIKKAKQ